MISKSYLGKIVKVVIDRPMGTKHPKFDWLYPVNYGFIQDTISGDGEELDAYVLGLDKAVNQFEGVCVAVIHRVNDNDDKLIVVPDGFSFTKEEIEKQVEFQEKWFEHKLVMIN